MEVKEWLEAADLESSLSGVIQLIKSCGVSVEVCDNNDLFECKYCDEHEFPNQQSLETHQKQFHQTISNNVENISEFIVDNDSPTLRQTESTSDIGQSHESIICKGCKNSIKSTSILRHLRAINCKVHYSKEELDAYRQKSYKTRKVKEQAKRLNKKLEDANQNVELIICKFCKESFLINGILRHLSRKKECENNYTEKEKNEFRKKCKEFSKKVQSSFSKNLEFFLNDIKMGPHYICICCMRGLFKRSVIEIDTKFKDHLSQIGKTNLVKFQAKYQFQDKFYTCKTCHNWLKKNKMPPQCFANGLELSNMPPIFKDLTSIEKQMLQKKLIFLKIRKLPRTRMPEINDRVINVPLESSDLVATATKLPRMGKELATVSVNFRRKLKYKTYHKFEKIRPAYVNYCLRYLYDHHAEYKDLEIHKLNENEEWIDIPNDEITELEFSCDNCESCFVSELELNEHMANMHFKAADDPEEKVHANENSLEDSENEEDDDENIFNAVTTLTPEEDLLESRIVINTSNTTIHKKLKKDGPIINIAPGKYI